MEIEEYQMIYKLNKNEDIRILGEEFVRNNKNKGRIIYKNKNYSLVGKFKTKNITKNTLKIKILLSKNCYNKSFMFSDCSTLLQIKFKDNSYNRENILYKDENFLFIQIPQSIYIQKFPNVDINIENDYLEWNTKISVMNAIFSNCSSLLLLPDISKWDTSNVIDMSKTFYNCSSLLLLPDISKWDTSNVIDMNKMFYNCISLSLYPDLSNWNTNNVSNRNKMFYISPLLSSLPNFIKSRDIIDFLRFIIEDYILSKVLSTENKKNKSMSSMFEKSS